MRALVILDNKNLSGIRQGRFRDSTSQRVTRPFLSRNVHFLSFYEHSGVASRLVPSQFQDSHCSSSHDT